MLRMRSAIGVPVVLPSYTPERISTLSSSWRCVTWREVPGLRRSRSGWMSASESSIPGGQPSITQPIAGPWDSPKVVTVKRVPRVLPDMVMRVYRVPGDRLGVQKPPGTDLMKRALLALALLLPASALAQPAVQASGATIVVPAFGEVTRPNDEAV